jgi:hypothetical protein
MNPKAILFIFCQRVSLKTVTTIDFEYIVFDSGRIAFIVTRYPVSVTLSSGSETRLKYFDSPGLTIMLSVSGTIQFGASVVILYFA